MTWIERFISGWIDVAQGVAKILTIGLVKINWD